VIGLAVGFPVVASILWGEHPSLRQWIGLALIPIAFMLCSPGRVKVEGK
jgi:drug/metabolite transporter (DMT)-like permease